MSVAQHDTQVKARLEDLPIGKIKPNAANPRLIFPQDELDQLADSIDQEGILVPIVVYKSGTGYVLIDGERRFRCAKTLGLKMIPALVVEKKPPRDVLLQMFNIHLIREPWRDIPTAKALGRLINELEKTGDDTSDKSMRELTGLSIERVRQLRYVLTLPTEWQDLINDTTVPLNFFWELKRILDALVKYRPKLSTALGGPDKIAQAFVEKRLDGVISDTVGLRKVRTIINFAAEDAESRGDNKSVLDKHLRDLVKKPDLSIDDVYEDTVQIMVEADKLERRTDAMLVSFERLLTKARTQDEIDLVRSIGKNFIKQLTPIVK